MKKVSFVKNAERTGGTKYYGIYRAKCLNNSDPKGQGRVLAHIYVRDGELNYNESTHNWIPVLSPYGGVRGMGFYMIPPIHADGFVIFEQGSPRTPVWVGTYPFAPVREVEEEASKKVGYTVVKTLPTVPDELNSDPTKIIIKTQYPALNDPAPESDSNKIENLIIMDETKLELVHVNQPEYSYKPGGVSTADATSYIKLADGIIELGVKDVSGRLQSIQITTDGIKMESSMGDYVQVKDGSIQIKGSDQCQIKIEAIENGAVVINGRQVMLDGETIILGPPGALGGGSVVTTQSICPFVGLPIHQGSSKVLIGV